MSNFSNSFFFVPIIQILSLSSFLNTSSETITLSKFPATTKNSKMHNFFLSLYTPHHHHYQNDPPHPHPYPSSSNNPQYTPNINAQNGEEKKIKWNINNLYVSPFHNNCVLILVYIYLFLIDVAFFLLFCVFLLSLKSKRSILLNYVYESNQISKQGMCKGRSLYLNMLSDVFLYSFNNNLIEFLWIEWKSKCLLLYSCFPNFGFALHRDPVLNKRFLELSYAGRETSFT